jgi:hypothetical protein
MKSRTLSATAMILLTPLVVLAFQAQAEQVRNRDLKNKSFTDSFLLSDITTKCACLARGVSYESRKAYLRAGSGAAKGRRYFSSDTEMISSSFRAMT